jgi:hypothetical protein
MLPHKINAPPCPHCSGVEYVIATDDAVEPGDWLLCIGCSGVFRMKADRTLRPTREDEWRMVPIKTRAAVAGIKAVLPIIRRARSANH